MFVSVRATVIMDFGVSMASFTEIEGLPPPKSKVFRFHETILRFEGEAMPFISHRSPIARSCFPVCGCVF